MSVVVALSPSLLFAQNNLTLSVTTMSSDTVQEKIKNYQAIFSLMT